jgi:predicted GH43/DUF377 family glycosyl hydrolase
MTFLTVDAGVELSARADRVVARFFLPGEGTPGGSSRTQAVLDRVLALPPEALAAAARRIRDRLVDPSPMADVLQNAAMVRLLDAPDLGADATMVIGAAFTAEYSIEGVSLCNPSTVEHPDQTGLMPGQLRVLLSLRSIGEGHLSSIQFCTAVIGPGLTWEFLRRQAPPCLPAVRHGEWTRDHFLRALEHNGGTDELVDAIGQTLPNRFRGQVIEQAIQALRAPLLQRRGARAQLDAMRIVADSAYDVIFPKESELSTRVLLPVADEERQGIEDLRLVQGLQADGARYGGTFTAYDGHAISSRLLTTTDFREFAVHRLTGPPAQTKGMALFPRQIGGEHLALSRGDGESLALTRSLDGLVWGAETILRTPTAAWEIVQIGNCGSPIETPQGWIVLTHGVGPLRVYSIGALLLDLEDPSRVIGVLPEPLIEPPQDSGGYVPNVVYSCGALLHDGILWIPYGVDDQRIRVAHVNVQRLLSAMTAPEDAGARRT